MSQINLEQIKKREIKSLYLEELKQEIVSLGEKPFRAKQIYSWLHQTRVDSFDVMTNVSKTLREKLEHRFEMTCLNVVEVLTSKVDQTQKYLFELADGCMIESVLMHYEHGNSVCISSQVGCRMGCRFCASTIGGLERNLTAGEMLAQVYQIQKLTNKRISNVVVMGSGEPLDNYEELLRFIRLLSSEYGEPISQRNITVSTCGLVPQMIALADKKLQITLALSLHTSNNEKRKVLMPIAFQYPLEEVMKACRYYFSQTGRRVTFEYSLVGGVNDTIEDANELIALLKGMNCHVNLIPVNPIKEREYVQSNKKVVESFKNKLEKCKINVTIRREMGRDINGACGQLRRSYTEKKQERES